VLERFGSESFEKGWISDGQIEKVRRGRRSGQAAGHQERHQDAPGRDGDAAVGGDHQEDHAAGGLREEELEVQVETEANQYIPFSLDEVSLDFCVIGPSPTSVGDVEVLIAASRKDRVQDRQGLAEAAG
jgi:Tfp pilus assembly protein, ATPase PilM